MEIYYGRDIRVAYPKGEFNIEPLDQHIEPGQLYYVREHKYQSNTVEFGPVKIWMRETELAADCKRLGEEPEEVAAEIERVNAACRIGLEHVKERVLRDYGLFSADKEVDPQCNSPK